MLNRLVQQWRRYQCLRDTAADVSVRLVQYHRGRGAGRGYVGDSNTSVEVVYNGGLYVFGGTSVGAPQWAALVALANAMRSSSATLTSANSALYSLAQYNGTYAVNSSYFFDITSGNNGTDPDEYSVVGYDLVTGVGSPVANNLLPALSLK